ncbi:unnamed protein product [Paramecium primaurelia]|uniref:Uncharacterized protein n=1 Tax=Paramecium primaurelia TaxID=5886 RepID=A0A8S1M9Q0_PARPR|nr:unnamed protein product [Paramecium primaurelia]
MMLILILYRLKTIKQQLKHLKYQKQQKMSSQNNCIFTLLIIQKCQVDVIMQDIKSFLLTKYNKLDSTKWSKLDRYSNKIIQNI